MKRCLSLVFSGALFGLLSMGCLAGDAFPDVFEQKPVSRFRPSKNAYYGPLAPPAKRLVATEEKNHHRQHFCAVGYKYDDGALVVWVHWKEEQRLILWRDSTDPELREGGLVRGHRDLKLGKDTVERKEDLKGSTYMVTRAWWDAVVSDCAAHGEKLKLAPFKVRAK